MAPAPPKALSSGEARRGKDASRARRDKNQDSSLQSHCAARASLGARAAKGGDRHAAAPRHGRTPAALVTNNLDDLEPRAGPGRAEWGLNGEPLPENTLAQTHTGRHTATCL